MRQGGPPISEVAVFMESPFARAVMREKMATVTYKNQPAMERTKGRVPLAGTSHVYRVNRLLWPNAVESFLQTLLIPRSLHLCCGHSSIGDVRADIDAGVFPHVVCDAAKLPFADESFDSVLCDPPYNGNFQWNHDVLSELSRIARKRIVFQHWFLPADPHGRWKKWHKFRLAEVYAWQPRTYFGRVQVITVFDASRESTANRADHDVASAKTPLIFRSPEGDCVRVFLSYSRGHDVRELLLLMAELNRLTAHPDSRRPRLQVARLSTGKF